MLSRIADRLTAVFRATAPDPFVLAILLTVFTFALALCFGAPDRFTASTGRALQVLDWWQGGFWNLLPFAMQMCLILVTGHALAASAPVARALRAISSLPRTGRQAVAMTAFVSIAAGLVNWGLGLIVGAILARDVGRAMRAKGVAVPYALLAAAAYTSLMCWHGGLSGSAPLSAANGADLARIVGEDLAGAVGGRIPLERTIFAPFNIAATGGLLVIIPIVMALLCPGKGSASAMAEAEMIPEPAPSALTTRPATIPEWLDRTPMAVWLFAAPALVWLARRFAERGLDALDLNTANLLFFALGVALHGSATRYMDAAAEAARGAAGIIIQFPLYAGIMAIMQSSGLVARIADLSAAAAGGNQSLLAVFTFLSAGVINLFIPSGGGQWAVQGPIALAAANATGADPGRLVMAVAYGDQWTNMIQPFWALPLLAITGAKAKEIVGYTAVALVVGGVWIGGCLAVV